MSYNNMPGGNGTGSGDADNIESLLAQLRRQSSPSPGPGAGNSNAGPDLLSQFGMNSHNHPHNQPNQSYYDHGHLAAANDGSASLSGNFQHVMDSPAFLPEAPTPPVHGFNHSQFPPSIMNPIGTGRVPPGAVASGSGGGDQTAHLLNLLKHSGQGGPQSHPQHQPAPHMTFPQAPIAPPVIHAPAPMGSDPSGLLAALMKGAVQADAPKPEPPSTSSWNPASPPSDTQQYLLNLLNRPKPSQNDASEHAEPGNLLTPPPADDGHDLDGSIGGRSAEQTLVGTFPSRSEFDFEPKNLESPPPKFGSTPHSQHSQPVSVSKSGVFGNYMGHLEDVSGSSPIQRTLKTSTTPGASGTTAPATQSAAPFQILRKPDSAQSIHHDQKRPLSDRGARDSPEHTRRKLDHPSSPLSHMSASRLPRAAVSPLSDTSVEIPRATPADSQEPAETKRHKESVAEAVSGIAEQADREADEALARAQDTQAHAEIAEDLEQMMKAETDAEFAQSAQVAAQAIKKELEKEENKDLLEATLDPEVAQEVRDIVDEAAYSGGQAPVADSWESAEADENAAPDDAVAPVKVYNFPMKPWITISVQDSEDSRPVFREEAILDIARLKKDFDQIDRNLVSASESYMAYGMSKAGGLRVIRQEDGKDAKLFTDTKDRIFNVAISTSPSNLNLKPKEAIIGTGVSGTVYWVQLKNGDRDHLEDAHPEQYGFALPPMSAQEGGDAPGGVLKTRARASSMHPDFFAVGRGKSINIIWPSFIFENNLFKNAHDRVVDTERLLKQCSLKINTGKAGKDFTFSPDDTLMVSLDKSGRVKFWDVRDLVAVKPDCDPLHPVPQNTSLEVKEPLMTLTTTPEGEKAWPTSVLLLDKYRPYQKRAALRYMIVGMKQNHTLQLWDLALGKPVQEFNFPHNKESDAVCSVMYHAPSSMIVVGHPTRNSIYFLHLSAPKYSLKNLSQVEYIQRLISQDSSIPQPESTAVISGIREYSFANKGVLRSLNILENPAASGEGDEPTLFELYAMHSKGVTCLFIKQAELGWTKDSKVIAPADAVEAGLVKISKLVAPPPHQPAEAQPAVPDANAAPPIRIATRKDAIQKIPSSQGEEKKGETSTPPKPDRKEENDTPVQREKPEKKNRKKKGGAGAAAAAAQNAAEAGTANAADREFPVPNGATAELNRSLSQGKGKSVARNNVSDSSALALTNQFADLTLAPGTVSQEHLDTVVNNMESSIVANMTGRIDSAFQALLKQMQDFQEHRDSAFVNNQSTLLQMVADVLNDNTEAVLKNLIIDQINSNVIPSLRSTIDKSVSDQFGAKSASHIATLQREVQKQLPAAVTQGIQKPDVVKAISDKICHNVNAHIDAQVTKSVNSLAPAVAKITAQALHQRLAEDVTIQIGQAFERLEDRRRDEDMKLDRLIGQTKDLSNAISSLAASQTQFQKDLAAMRRQLEERAQDSEPARSHARSHGSGVSHNQPPPLPPPEAVYSRELQEHSHAPQHGHMTHQQQHPYPNHEQQLVFAPTTREEREKIQTKLFLDETDDLMRRGLFDQAVMRWLQAGDKTEQVFQHVISKYNATTVLVDLQPLLLLSVGATVSSDLTRNTPKLVEKVAYLEMVMLRFHQMIPEIDDQVRDVTPRIMSLIKHRAESLLREINRIAPQDGGLKVLHQIVNHAGRITDAVMMSNSHHNLGHLGAPF